MEKKMKKVKNVQNLVVAIAMTVAGVVCLGAYVCIGPDFRLLVAAFIAVSYTHLDVYKRQPLRMPAKSLAWK